VTLPSSAEVEHADWPALKTFATELGLNPKGRSGIVRQRVLDHVRTQAGGPSWRAGKSEQAALLTRIGPADLAARLWESTITLDAPAPWVGLGTAYLKAGRTEEALKCYDRAIGMGDVGARLHRAQALMRAGRSDAAVAEVDRALAANPENVRAWAMRAVISEAAGHPEEALSSQGMIADLGRGHLGLAKFLMRAGRFEDAVKALDVHLSTHPKDALGWNQRGVALAKRGEWRGAVEALRTATGLTPRDPGILNNLAIAFAGAGRIGEAVKRIASARRISEDPRILLNDAALRERHGSSATARDVYDRVLEVAPEHPEAVAGKRRVARKTKSTRKPRPAPSKAARPRAGAKPRPRTRKSPAKTKTSKSRTR
jgi:Flp pilus assembly protein TadD